MARRKFIFVAEGDVFMRLMFDDEQSPSGERYVAGLKSNPIIIEVHPDSPVASGWTWNGTNFTPPK